MPRSAPTPNRGGGAYAASCVLATRTSALTRRGSSIARRVNKHAGRQVNIVVGRATRADGTSQVVAYVGKRVTSWIFANSLMNGTVCEGSKGLI
jgi:hypothetical protein